MSGDSNNENTTTTNPLIGSGVSADVTKRVDGLIEKNDLKSLYVAERKFGANYEKDSSRYWYNETDWQKSKDSEATRVVKAEKNFDEVQKGRLLKLYQNQVDTLGSLHDVVQSGLDGKIVEAFKERNGAHRRVDSQRDLTEKVQKQFKGEGPSLVDKMVENYDLSQNRLSRKDYDAAISQNALGTDLGLRSNASGPRDSELRWMRDNTNRFADQKRACNTNFESVLTKGETIGNVTYNETDTLKANNGWRGRLKSVVEGTGYSLLDFVNRAANGSGERFKDFSSGGRSTSMGDTNHEALGKWGAYRDMKEKEKSLANSYSSNLGFISKNSLHQLEAIRDSVQQSLQTTTDPLERAALQKYFDDIGRNIKALEAALEKEKKGERGVESQLADLGDKTDRKMQDAMDDKNARLKWNILCLLMMASPFAQGLAVIGPLFDYLNFLGDIMGPVFLNEDGFAAGFAEALENFPIFGDLLKAIQFSDGIEIVLNETPLLNAFTGEGGMIDGLTRNGIFTGIAETINFEVLSLPLAIGAAGYFTVTNVNATIGEDTTNTKPSIKSIKDKHKEGLKEILEEAVRKSDKVDEKFIYKHHEDVTKHNREFFKRIAIAELLDGAMETNSENGKLDKLLGLFDGITGFDELTEQSDKVKMIEDKLAGKEFLEWNEFKEDDQSPFMKVATVLANELSKQEDVSSDKLFDKVKAKNNDEAFKVADNAFAIHYFYKEVKDLDIPESKLLDMIEHNNAKDFDEVKKIKGELDKTIAHSRAKNDMDNGKRSFAEPTMPTKPTAQDLEEKPGRSPSPTSGHRSLGSTRASGRGGAE